MVAGSAALGAEATLGGAVTVSDVEMAVLGAGELSILAALAAGGPGVWVGLAVVVRGGAVTVSALERAVLGPGSRHVVSACSVFAEHQGRSMHMHQAGC